MVENGGALKNDKGATLPPLMILLRCDTSLTQNQQLSTVATAQLESLLCNWENIEELFGSIEKNKLAKTIDATHCFSRLPAQLQDGVKTLAWDSARESIAVAAELRSLVRVLKNEKINALFYKGIPLALRSAGILDIRGAGDIDVLVNRSDVTRVHKILVASGYRPQFGIIPHPVWRWRLFTWLFKELPYISKKAQVDLHWRPLQSNSVIPEFEVLMGRRTSIALGEIEVPTLSDSDALTLMCLAFWSDGCQNIKQLVDIRRLQLLAPTAVSEGYSRQLLAIRNAVLEFCNLIFTDEGTSRRLTKREAKLLAEVEKRWRAPTASESTSSPIVSTQTHVFALRTAWLAGSGFRNILSYLAGRLFEFRNTDFSKGGPILTRALFREVDFQIRNRFGRPATRKEGS